MALIAAKQVANPTYTAIFSIQGEVETVTRTLGQTVHSAILTAR